MTAALDPPVLTGAHTPNVAAEVHTDTAAQRLGFRGALVPATAVYAAAFRPAADRWGEAWFGHAVATLRHRRPVYAEDELFVTFDAPRHGRGATTVRIDNHADEQVALGHIALCGPDDSTPPPPPRSSPIERVVVTPGGLRAGLTVAYLPRPLDASLLGRFAGRAVENMRGIETELALAMHISTHAGFETFEHIRPGLHYEGGIHYLGRASMGCMIEGRGAIREVYTRNGHHYYDAIVHVFADDRAIAVVRQTVLYAVGSRVA
jgi:hypothetical protein